MNIIASIVNPALVSRNEHLLAETSILVDKNFHGGQTLKRGALMGKIVSSGKYRAYVEIAVKTGGAFSTAAATFTVDKSTLIGQSDLAVGDVIEDTAGNALGTIATYNPATGVGTLSGNSGSNLAAGGLVRVALSQLSLAKAAGKLLQDETYIDPAQDTVATGWFEGFFIQANSTITAAASTAMGAKNIDTGEIRLV